MDKEKEKDTKKLNAEELEKRVAPLTVGVTDPTQDPTVSSQGHGSKDKNKTPQPIGGPSGPGKQYVP